MSRILYMDDDVPQAIELAKKLRAAQHDVVVVHNAEQAREELWHWDFDVLISDIVIRKDGHPISDSGFALIGWVRHKATLMPELRYLPIIAVSGAQSHPAMQFVLPTAKRIGADYVLEKPLDFEKLSLALNEISCRMAG